MRRGGGAAPLDDNAWLGPDADLEEPALGVPCRRQPSVACLRKDPLASQPTLLLP